MNEALKQFSNELAEKFKAHMQESAMVNFVATVKASGDDRSFEVVMSTADEDRQGDELDQSKWDLKYFEMNPVLLWAHNYQSFPIGIVTDIKIEGDKAVATGKFAPAGINPEADMACALYQEKILRAVSPGYIQNDDGTRELLEVSFCPVPAGRFALSLKQTRELGVSTRELITKGFFFDDKPPIKKDDDPPERKSPQVGDHCQLDDGTPGVLAGDEKNPGELVCVPERDKSQSPSMKSELEKQFKAEHGRHGEAVGKAIDEFETKTFPDEKKAKENQDGADNSETDKAIEEFKDALDAEHGTHLEKCMKAIDDTYDTFGRESNEEGKTFTDEEKAALVKSIDEFKSAVNAEHLNHVKAFHKAIDEFSKDFSGADADGQKKAIDEFEKKSGDELSRHEQAHEKLLKDEMGEGDAGEKALAEEIIKSGRAISAKNKGKIEAAIKALENHHTAQTAEHEKTTNDVIASLKELMGSPQDDDGEDQKPDEKSAAAPKPRSSSAGAATNGEMSELEAYLFAQRLVRQIKSASEDGLRQLKEVLKAKYPSRR